MSVPAQQESKPKLRVAIVGGGIGGLTLAVALCQMKLDDYIHVDLYESTAKLMQVGAGIMLWPRGWEVIEHMGLGEALRKHLAPGQGSTSDELKTVLKLRKGDQNPGAPIVDIKMKGGGYSFHRAEVQDVLLAHLSSCVMLHLSHRLASYKQANNRVELEFKDGKTATCDILIGADGINSAVRRSMLTIGRDDLSQEEKELLYRPVWTGGITYRALIDAEVVRREMPGHSVFKSPTLYGGKNKHIIVYPILGGKIINVVPFFLDPTKEGTQYEGQAVIEETTDDIPAVYAGWEDEVQVIVKSITKASRWAIQEVRPLDSYVSGRVGLLGDAAHAMPPHLGNGAGQAIEDAFILANLISKAVHYPNPDVTRVLEVYDTIRQPFGNFVATASKHQGNLDDFAVPGYEDLKEGQALPLETLKKHGEALDNGWEWTWKTSLMGDLEKALAML